MGLSERIKDQINNIRNYGINYEMYRIKYGLLSRYNSKTYYKKIHITDEERENQKSKKYNRKIVFSVIVPLYNTPEKFLREMIESVKNQTYDQWELCLADGSDSEHQYVGRISNEYAVCDDRIKYKLLETNVGISENTNKCIEMSTGEYIVLFDHDDMLHEAALYELRKAIDEKAADFIYTDEAIFSKDYHKPDNYHFKTDFALDDIRSNNYICHITCFSKKLLNEVGLFRKEYDGSQDFDMVLRLTEKAENIVHIPKVLYFWRCHAQSVASDISAKTYCIDAGQLAVRSHLERCNVKAEVRSSEIFPAIYKVTYELVGSPKVSVIITKQYNECEECIDSLKENTAYRNFEILICDNIVDRNMVAQSAAGEYLLFINDGCRFDKKEWMTELLSIAQREGVGAVGGKTIYANNTIRDAGITIGVGVGCKASSDYFRMANDIKTSGYNGNLYFTHEKTAINDCNMMISKKIFENIGGFDINLSEWFAGIDICLRLKKENYYNVINTNAEIRYNHPDNNRDKNGCYKDKKKNIATISERWEKQLSGKDNCYNPNLTKKTSCWMVG